MRRYTLASSEARNDVNLKDYKDIIQAAVLEFFPNAQVTVGQKYYTVSPTPPQGVAVKIGRKICQSALATHCISIPKLFYSVNLDKKE